MKCFRKLLGLPYTAHRTNESVKQQVIRLAGTYETLLGIIRRRKLQWFGHTSRHSGTLSHTILQGYIEGKRRQGRPKTTWMTNIGTWTDRTVVECHRLAENRKRWMQRRPYGRLRQLRVERVIAYMWRVLSWRGCDSEPRETIFGARLLLPQYEQMSFGRVFFCF